MKVTRFGNPSLKSINPSRPIRVAFLTSVRDTGACDQNGRTIAYPDGERYMKGVIEAMVRATFPGGSLYGVCEVVRVITDDHETDNLNGYPCQPTEGKPWIHPLDLCLPNGQTLASRTVNVPSLFRKLPLSDKEGRRLGKLEFERRILGLFHQAEADVLVSDHYMARIEHLICSEMGLMGRVVNIHPAITLADHKFCMRGPTPTADAIRKARINGTTVTGATLHFVNCVIDDGPPIAVAEGTPVFPGDQPQQLRDRNYRLAKAPLFLEGMQHYATCIFPHLDQLDPNNLQEC
ncbi:MAG: formyltransferase family protein [Patescibacteria group bacterium]|nr:hypothetical protein [Patescibacteria group bacterium]